MSPNSKRLSIHLKRRFWRLVLHAKSLSRSMASQSCSLFYLLTAHTDPAASIIFLCIIAFLITAIFERGRQHVQQLQRLFRAQATTASTRISHLESTIFNPKLNVVNIYTILRHHALVSPLKFRRSLALPGREKNILVFLLTHLYSNIITHTLVPCPGNVCDVYTIFPGLI